MRIDAFNRISELYKATSTKKITKTNGTTKADKLEISQIGKDYQIAKQAVASASDIRADRVQELKKAMASGTYSVGAEELADKLTKNYFDQSI